MADDLIFLAGHRAYERIRSQGLSSDDVSMVVGASGAAKWLVLHGLESALFGQWFAGRKKPLHLFGTSIGSWKSAAAAQDDPIPGFDRLAHAYIHQYYNGKATPRQVAKEADRIMDACLTPGMAEEILDHPYCRLHLSAVRCRGPLASDHPLAMAAGLAAAWGTNRISRNLFRRQCRPTLFYDPRDVPSFSNNGEFTGGAVPLTPENLRQALLASGSIPYVMEGIQGIPGAPEGVYRDGGLFHYHPAFDFLNGEEGIVLYPHFYSQVTLGWFDKNRPARIADGSLLSDVLLLAPSPSFVAALPLGRIPDRRDFDRLAGRDGDRVEFWEKSVAMGRRLGDQFLEAVASGRIRKIVRKIP
ncbi:MAG: patatin-like phospholipase family protein [Desulfobacteraceae bacterium]|nr:patatin-like phospholipase family protein [Desulfobacteraceae bacterium]